MATLQLAAQEATELKLAQLDLIIDPKPEWNQLEPHIFVRLSIGNTVDGAFSKLYDKELRWTAAKVMRFLTSFQDLDGRFFQFLIDEGDIDGIIK